MDALDVIIEQADDKILQLKDYLAQGRAETFEEYKRLCGEIKGLLFVKAYMRDLKQQLENSDDE